MWNVAKNAKFFYKHNSWRQAADWKVWRHVIVVNIEVACVSIFRAHFWTPLKVMATLFSIFKLAGWVLDRVVVFVKLVATEDLLLQAGHLIRDVWLVGA